MAVNFEIRQLNDKKEEITIPLIAALKQLSYGISNNYCCLDGGKIGKYTVMYDEKCIGRGFEVWIEDNDAFFRLPLPTTEKDIKLAYSLAEKLCKYLGLDSYICDDEVVGLGKSRKYIKSNIQTSIGVMKHFENEVRSGNQEHMIMFGALNPIYLGEKEFDAIGGTLKGLEELLDRLQKMDVFYANPKYYQLQDGSIVGMYFVGEEIESVVPIKPGSPFYKIENISGYYVRVPDGNDIPYEEFLEQTVNKDDYDSNHIICYLDEETLTYMADNCAYDMVNKQKVKGKYWGRLLDNGNSHLRKIRDLQLDVEELAALNHIAVFLRWGAENNLLSEKLLSEIPDLMELVHNKTVDLREILAFHPTFGCRLQAIHFNETAQKFVKKFYVFKGDGYPTCVDNYAEKVLGREKYNCKEYKNEAYLFVPYDEAYYQGVSKYIDDAWRKWNDKGEADYEI